MRTRAVLAGSAGDGLHGVVGKALGVQHHGQRIAAEGAVGEHIDGDEAAFHRGACIQLTSDLKIDQGQHPVKKHIVWVQGKIPHLRGLDPLPRGAR
jgi:hypothetical protein